MRHSIDLTYRPHSYFWAEELGVHLSSHIKGAERKAVYEALIASGRAEEADEILTCHALSEEDRAAFGRLHPSFMGGEYLPNRQSQEVEIARITIASTTRDVTCVYARQGAGRIHYRVVDEYGGDTLSGKSACTSTKPLSLGQLTNFFLGAWDLLNVLGFNFEHPSYSEDEIKAFVLDASSSYYVEFGQLIDARIDRWIRSRKRQQRA